MVKETVRPGRKDQYCFPIFMRETEHLPSVKEVLQPGSLSGLGPRSQKLVSNILSQHHQQGPTHAGRLRQGQSGRA